MVDFSIPVSFSMASFKMAVDIKPADISPKGSDVKPSASAPPAKQESFDNVLKRVEKDSGPADKASRSEAKEKPSTSRKDEKAKMSSADQQTAGDPQAVNPDKPVQEAQPDSTTGAASENGKPVTPVVSQTAQEPSSLLQGEAVSQAIRDFVAGEIAAMAVVNGSTGNVTGTGTVNSGSPVDISTMVIPAAGNIGPTGPLETVLPDKTTGIPLPGENQVIPDISMIRDAITEIADDAGSRFVEIPSFSSRQPLPSDWTETLDFKRLMDPGVDRDPVWEPRMSQPPVRLQATDPVIRPEISEVSRTPVTSRFDAEMSPVKNLDPGALFAGVKPEAGMLNPSIRDTGILFDASYRPPVNISLETSPVTNAVVNTPPAIQARPTSLPSASSGTPQIDSEALLNDVREVFMRIASDGTGQAKIVLHPPELGELVVRLQSARNGIVRAEFQTLSPLVREALEAGITRLTDALKSEGLTLAQAEVHLNLQHNPDGNSGQSDFSFQGRDNLMGSGVDFSAADAVQEPSIFVERLPDGATISIFA